MDKQAQYSPSKPGLLFGPDWDMKSKTYLYQIFES